MTALLHPLIKSLGQAKKAFLSPLTRYWLKPFCDDVKHHLNYSGLTYWPALGGSVLIFSVRGKVLTMNWLNFELTTATYAHRVSAHFQIAMFQAHLERGKILRMLKKGTLGTA
jgi:hypothetical protein